MKEIHHPWIWVSEKTEKKCNFYKCYFDLVCLIIFKNKYLIGTFYFYSHFYF